MSAELELRILSLEKRVSELEAKKGKKKAGISNHVWESYRTAFANRYRTEPPRNARVNSMLSQLVGLVGDQEAGRLAEFYLRQNDSWYVQRHHPVESLIKDHHTLQVRMKTGRTVTQDQARKIENASTTAKASEEYLKQKYDNP